MSMDAFKPKVLIVGAGLGGLTLAAILERASIPYEIYEKASALKPLGSAISIGPGLMPLFTQLGIIEQIQALGIIFKTSTMKKENMELIHEFDWATGAVERAGWPGMIISRPTLHNMLLSLIPREKIHLNKRVLSHVETGDGIIIRTSDNKTHQGNILVGADGTYSGVRQSLYEQLNKEGKLPALDKEPLTYSTICLVGQTRPLDEETYPHINDEFCKYEVVLGQERPLFCVTFTTAEKTVCWMAVEVLSKESAKKHDSFRTSEWGPEAAAAMCNEIRDFPMRPDLTMGDLIDQTPEEVICKVMLEEKIFETWTSGRTVLMGDACHKMSPAAGIGAQSAMFDAVILANHINTLHMNDLAAVEKALKAYRDERFEHGRQAVASSGAVANVMKQNLSGFLTRWIMINAPQWLWLMMSDAKSAYRPQVSFLPPVEDKGTRAPKHQPSLLSTRPKTLVQA